MAFDAHKNLAIATIATAPVPPQSGTSLTVQTGEGSRFPVAPFNATVFPANAAISPSNAEIVRVTARTNDTLTIVRAQESTTVRTILAGDLIAATITAKSLQDIENGTNFPQIATTSATLSGNLLFTGAGSQISRSTNDGPLYVIGGTGGGSAAYFALYGFSYTPAPGLMEIAANKITLATGGGYRQVINQSGGIRFGANGDDGVGSYGFHSPSHVYLMLNAAAGSHVYQMWQRANVTKWFNVMFGAQEELQWVGADSQIKLTLFQNGNLDAAGTVTMRSLGLSGPTGTVLLNAETLASLLDRVTDLEARLAALESR